MDMTIEIGAPTIPLWIDADPSGLYYTGLDCDDDVAILAALALHQRKAIQFEGLSICGGNAPLRHTWNDARILWEHASGFELTGVKPRKGYGWRSMQVGVKFLEYYNGIYPDVLDSDDASLALAQRLRDDSLPPLTILTLGPPTNVAKMILHHEGVMSRAINSKGTNIEHVYLMGGEMTNQQLDLNFRTDRASARVVLEANVPKTIIPIQTCGQVAVTESWLQKLDCGENPGMAVCAWLPKMRQQVRIMPRVVNAAVEERMTTKKRDRMNHHGSGTGSHDLDHTIWNPSPNLHQGFIPWDLVALFSITHPEIFSNWRYHRVSFPRCNYREPCDGNMNVIEDLGTDFHGADWSGIVRVPHGLRNETELLELILDAVSDVEARSPHHPRLLWGFVSELSGIGVAVLVTVASIIILRRGRQDKVMFCA